MAISKSQIRHEKASKEYRKLAKNVNKKLRDFEKGLGGEVYELSYAYRQAQKLLEKQGRKRFKESGNYKENYQTMEKMVKDLENYNKLAYSTFAKYKKGLQERTTSLLINKMETAEKSEVADTDFLEIKTGTNDYAKASGKLRKKVKSDVVKNQDVIKLAKLWKKFEDNKDLIPFITSDDIREMVDGKTYLNDPNIFLLDKEGNQIFKEDDEEKNLASQEEIVLQFLISDTINYDQFKKWSQKG